MLSPTSEVASLFRFLLELANSHQRGALLRLSMWHFCRFVLDIHYFVE